MELTEAMDGTGEEGSVTALTACVGVATGRIFCGVAGSSERQEYTTMGDVVNVAARLMQLAMRDGGSTTPRLRVDEETMTFSNDVIQYKQLPPEKLKGKSGSAHIRAVGELESKQQGGSVGKRGRDAEWQRLRSSVAELLTYQLGGTIVVMGMRGSGKKLLVQALQQHGEAAHMLVALGRGG